MNISKAEQRTLHALAQGGTIHVTKDDKGKIIEVDCFNREGWRLADCTLDIFTRLKGKRLVGSEDSRPYRITRKGLQSVRSQLDNR